ncbi:MAG: thioredoxin family protein [Syntrophomonadaceae bacterium]|jgi:thiol-disulfide isomerase/thioredoxin
MKFDGKLLFRLTLIILGGFLIINGLADKKASDQSTQPGNSTFNESINAEQTIANAQKEGLAVWVLFGTDTCPYCKDQLVSFDELQPEYEKKARFVYVNLSKRENTTLGNQYKIQVVPTSIILNNKGQISFEQAGLLANDVLKHELDKATDSE